MIVLVMGPTGAGKTTIGKLLAQQLDWAFLDADDFHPPGNIEKMKRGIPLTDADREPWLTAIHEELARQNAAGKSCVLACSALKESYREKLAVGLEMRIIYLKGSYEEMKRHILARQGHFAGEAILAGQFADLEEPRDAILVSVAHTPEEIIAEVRTQLKLA
jgi:gluconokinase